MSASSSPFNGLVWDDIKDRPLWTPSLKWDSSSKEIWPIFDYKPGLHQYNPEKWPGKVILVDTWVKIIDKNMSEIRRVIRLGDGDIERTKNTLSVLSGLLVEKWPLNFGPDAKSFLKQPKKPVDPKRPTSSILSLPEPQSTVTKQASTSHKSSPSLLVRLKLPTKLRSDPLSISPPQPSSSGRRKHPVVEIKKGARLSLKFGGFGTIKATATQSSNGQTLQTPPQDIPRLNGGLLDSYMAFKTSVDKNRQGRQEFNTKSERELSECHKRINGLQAELEETRLQVARKHDRVLELENEKEMRRVDQNKYLEREQKLQKECEEKDARLAQMAEKLREAERKLKENEKESIEVIELMKQDTKRWEDDTESLGRKRQRT